MKTEIQMLGLCWRLSRLEIEFTNNFKPMPYFSSLDELKHWKRKLLEFQAKKDMIQREIETVAHIASADSVAYLQGKVYDICVSISTTMTNLVGQELEIKEQLKHGNGSDS